VGEGDAGEEGAAGPQHPGARTAGVEVVQMLLVWQRLQPEQRSKL